MIKITKMRLLVLALWVSIFTTFLFIPVSKMFFQPTLRFIFRLIRQQNGTKYVLHWVPPWTDTRFYLDGEGFEPFQGCPVNNCYATHDRKLIPEEEFDAILFHRPNKRHMRYNKPSIRNSFQRYVFVTMKPPTSEYPSVLHREKWFYNWTMTYRTDSDVMVPYGYIRKEDTNYSIPTREDVSNKTQLAAWIAFECSSPSNRESLINSLKEVIKIDIYGDCGNFYCPEGSQSSKSECLKSVEDTYKFYLALEDCYCKDYVTEELYEVLKTNLIPVVYGAADYENIAPPSSVIVAGKFSNPQLLADYLLYLDETPDAYLRFFEWKMNYTIQMRNNSPMCKLCKMLHDPSLPEKVYEDMFEWWRGKNNTICEYEQTFPDISFAIL